MTGEQYDNTNRGGIWINKRKEKDTHPDYTGSVNIDGVEYWVSAWKRYSAKTGEPFLSLAVKRKDEQPSGGGKKAYDDDFLGATKKSTVGGIDPSDDLPF